MLNKTRNAFTLFELLVAMFIVSILICVLVNAVQNARNLADKMICQNRLKQLGIGLQLYHETNSVFPRGIDRYQVPNLADLPVGLVMSYLMLMNYICKMRR